MQDAWELSLTMFLYIKNDSKIIYYLFKKIF